MTELAKNGVCLQEFYFFYTEKTSLKILFKLCPFQTMTSQLSLFTPINQDSIQCQSIPVYLSRFKSIQVDSKRFLSLFKSNVDASRFYSIIASLRHDTTSHDHHHRQKATIRSRKTRFARSKIYISNLTNQFFVSFQYLLQMMGMSEN